jgi:hypothetical protein
MASAGATQSGNKMTAVSAGGVGVGRRNTLGPYEISLASQVHISSRQASSTRVGSLYYSLLADTGLQTAYYFTTGILIICNTTIDTFLQLLFCFSSVLLIFREELEGS